MAENDLSLLIKMMKMTTASEDTVALVALRKANDFIRNKLSSDWESILTGKVTIIEDPFKSIDIPTAYNNSSRPAPPPPPAASPSRPPPRPFQNAPRPQPTRPGPTPQPTQNFGPITVNYCSLANGAWGLRSNQPLKVGQKISVTKRNGKVKTEFVGNFIKNAYGDYIYDVGINPAAATGNIGSVI